MEFLPSVSSFFCFFSRNHFLEGGFTFQWGTLFLSKVVEHFCYLDDEDKQGWHRGVVLGMSGKDGFQVCYNDFPDVIYWREIYKDFKVGYVRLVELKPKDLIGAIIWICKQMGNLMTTFGGMQKLLMWTLILMMQMNKIFLLFIMKMEKLKRASRRNRDIIWHQS